MRIPLLTLAASLALAGCAHMTNQNPSASRWQSSRQLVLVTIPGWNSDHGSLRRYARDAQGQWSAVAAAQTVVIGRSGAAWGIGLHPMPLAHVQSDGPIKHEGDGRSPAGVFAIGEAFGYGASAQTALPYAPMRASNYCIDVSDSPLYNRIVDASLVGDAAVVGSTEPMRRDIHADGDQRYRLGFVIEHNPASDDADATPAAGSCIFAHIWKSPETTTAGCTAMQADAMQQTLAWLDPAMRPIFVLLPQTEYKRLQHSWGLPVLEMPK